MSKKSLIAMSGGVDSSVAAFLIKQEGYDTTGMTMKLFDNDGVEISSKKSCCSLEDVEDAKVLLENLGFLILYIILKIHLMKMLSNDLLNPM